MRSSGRDLTYGAAEACSDANLGFPPHQGVALYIQKMQTWAPSAPLRAAVFGVRRSSPIFWIYVASVFVN